jgi:hypothetical protein
MRGALADRVHILCAIADDVHATAAERIRAIEVLARFGLGTEDEHEVHAARAGQVEEAEWRFGDRVIRFGGPAATESHRG